jgi:hypothetical protein
MSRAPFAVALVVLVLVAACSAASDDVGSAAHAGEGDDAATATDAAVHDAAADASTADGDASDDGPSDGHTTPECAVYGAPGTCVTASACAALGDHTSYQGHCPGPSTIECCIDTPDVADNPPVPSGYKPMAQSQVTPQMTAWAVSILNDYATYPMFSTRTKTFDELIALARVEWHPPDFQNSIVHRGVTLYEPL